MSVSIPLSAYTWTDSSNSTWPICNTKFIYGILGPTENVQSGSTYYTCSNLSFGSLNVISISQGNSNLIGLTSFTDAIGVTRQTISANQSGIYRIRTTLSFSGAGLTNPTYISVWFSDSNYNNVPVNYNNIVPIDPSSNPTISDLSANQFLSFGYLYANSSSYNNLNTSTSYGYGYKPYFSINSGYISPTLTNNGLSVVEEMLYLQAYKPLFFNIQCNTPVYLNAAGNFTLELLSYLPPILTGITNTVDISYSAVQLSNEYKYIEFYPTTASGTATITFSSNINLNYLLVGGGGGGGGGYYETFTGGTSVIGGGGGGGGGSAINGSFSASSFNIYVGNFGVYGNGNVAGQTGYQSSIGKISSNSNIAIAYGGGGGGCYNNISQGGGVWNPVQDPSGNGTKYNAVNGGYGVNFNQQNSNGSNGYTIILPFKTYYMEGAGGGGGNFNQSTSYGGGNNIGGSYSGASHQQGSTTITGSGYGTGGGGGTPTGIPGPPQTYNTSGGNGGPGLVVLYWQ